MKFFFEADPEAEDANLTPQEESGFFSHQVKDVVQDGDAVEDLMQDAHLGEPVQAQSEAALSDIIEDHLLHAQFGYVREDYVIHFSTLNEKRNFNNMKRYLEVMTKVIDAVMVKVSKSLQVHFTAPVQSSEIATTSIVIKGARNDLSFDHMIFNTLVESKLVPFLLAELKQPGSGLKDFNAQD